MSFLCWAQNDVQRLLKNPPDNVTQETKDHTASSIMRLIKALNQIDTFIMNKS